MKKTVCTMAALMLFTLALNGFVWAQSFDHKVRADIPFSFYAGDKMLPAGSYTFRFDSENHSLVIANNQNGGGALLIGTADSVGKRGASVLVFRTDGEGVYALQSLTGYDFALSFRADKTLARLAAVRAPNRATTITAAP